MAGIFRLTRFRSVKDAAGTKLENTSLSTGVLQRVCLKIPAMLSCFSAKTLLNLNNAVLMFVR